MKNRLVGYINTFFDQLHVYEDETHGHEYKAFLHQSILKFLENENKETAFDVYLTFFDAYKINMGDENNQFLDLLDMMRSYEEKASTITAKQRDHYVHSVNVFLLGLAIYGMNSNYRDFFTRKITEIENYPHAYETENEEFFYRWGITSLFHDVGYPVEIINKQINHYLNFVVEAVYDVEGILAKNEIRTFIEYEDFSKFNRLPDAGDFKNFSGEFLTGQDLLDLENATRPIDLLAHSISKSYSLDFVAVKEKLDGFVNDMQKFGFVDHGFYSAIIVLQWYAYLMQKSGWNSNYYFNPIVECASAILLHNYYGNVLQKKPFDLGPMSPEEQPLAYLLVLCDELQEWNREAYGYLDKRSIAADRSDVKISEAAFKAVYISDKSLLGDDFERKKEELLYKRLDLAAIFKDGFEVDSVNADSALWRIQKSYDSPSPVARPLLGQLENIAKMIHELFIEDQKDRQKSDAPEMRSWEELPEDMKYSNLSQARHIAEKLRLVGCGIAPKDSIFETLEGFSNEEIEYLSVVEHDRWMHERFSSGWKYGEIKNVDERISPYLVPWNELSEDVKDLDRNAVRNIAKLLDSVGLAAYRVKKG